MENFILENDIKVFYVTTASFPQGIMEAHQKLHSLVPFTTERTYFGLSRPENNNGIIYRAAATELYDGEGAQLKCEYLAIQKGTYASIVIKDYMNDLPAIENTFQQLLAQPGLDLNGYCVEWYLGEKEMRCMVRLTSN